MAGMKVFRERGESISGNVNSARRNFHSTSTEDGYTIGQFKSNLMPNCGLVCYDMEQAEHHPVPEVEPFPG